MQTSSSSFPVPRRALLGAAAAVPALAVLGAAPQASASSPTALNLPAPPAGGLPLAQIFEPAASFDRSYYDDQTYFVWGSQVPDPWPGVPGATYLPAFRDPDAAHDLAWFQANHPTWLIYQADHVTPAYTYVYSWGAYCPLDVSNPDVREFYWDTYIQPRIDAGYTMIALDNVAWYNKGLERQGRFDDNGDWVQMFAGTVSDPLHSAWVVDWIRWVVSRAHAQGIGVAANIGSSALEPQLDDPIVRACVTDLCEAVDIFLDELGATAARATNITDGAWRKKFLLTRSVIATGKPMVFINQMATRALADADPHQVDWAIANFLLVRNTSSLFTLCGLQEYKVLIAHPKLEIKVGTPIGDPEEQSSGAWVRRYRCGFVAVNPSSRASATVTLPSGNWHTFDGTILNGSVTLTPMTGLTLTRGNQVPRR